MARSIESPVSEARRLHRYVRRADEISSYDIEAIDARLHPSVAISEEDDGTVDSRQTRHNS